MNSYLSININNKTSLNYNTIINIELNKSKKSKIINETELFDKISKSLNLCDIFNIQYIEYMITLNPLFELLFIEFGHIKFNVNKKYHIQTLPIINNLDKNEIIKLLHVLISMNKIAVNSNVKYDNIENSIIIIVIIIYDIIFNNFQIVINNIDFANIVKKKINDFKIEKVKIDVICNKYNLPNDIFDKWNDIIELNL